MRLLALDQPLDRVREDRTPLVAARRRASVLATLGGVLILTAAAAVVAGQGAGPQITLVTPQHGAAEVAAEASGGPSAVVAAGCGSQASAGPPTYVVRFDDGTRVTRTVGDPGGATTVRTDEETGLPLPGVRLEFTQRADGGWSCSPRYG
jgi:hypothetical protein